MRKNNSLIRTIWSFIYPLLIFIGTEIIVEFGFSIVATTYLMTTGVTDQQTILDWILDKTLYIVSIRNVILVPIFILLMRYDIRKDKLADALPEYTPYDKRWLIVLPFAGFMAALSFNHVVPMVLELLQEFISMLFNADVDFFKAFNAASTVTYSQVMALQIISSVILAPLVEEFLMRGIIYRRIRQHLGPIMTNICTAFIFGMIHGNAVQFTYAFIIGLILGYVYEKFKTVWAPIILHVGANLISVVVTAISDGEIFATDIGTYMLVVVVELALTFVLLRIIDVKVNREQIN